MDDFVLLLNSKEECKKVKESITMFLNKELKLSLNKKTNYFKNIQGVNFCGYKIKNNQIKIMKSNKKKIYKKIKIWNKLYSQKKLDFKKTNQSLQAWIGHAKHSSNKGIIEDVKNKCNWIYRGEEKLENGN